MTHKQEAALVLTIAIALITGLLAFTTCRDSAGLHQPQALVTPLHP